jgi:hypothetical protein
MAVTLDMNRRHISDIELPAGPMPREDHFSGKLLCTFSALLALLVGSSQLIACAQEQEAERLNSSLQGQAATSSQTPDSSPPSQEEKKPERIFGVVPAYSITDAQNAPPLTSKQKFHLFVSGTLDPFPFVAYAIQAGIEQAGDEHRGYGQGAAGYAKRFGAALADGTSARFFATYAFPSLLHQDPRYFREGEGSGWSRACYSMSRSFVTRSDSGKTQPNWSNILGKFTAAGLSNLYYPADERGGSLTLSRVAISMSYQVLGNLAIEFWPDIHRKVLGGNKKQGVQTRN